MKNEKSKGEGRKLPGLWRRIWIGLATAVLIVLCIWLRIWPWILGILGGILLLVLGLLVILIFVPVRYKGETEKKDRLRARVMASWLFRLVYFTGNYDENGFRWKLRIFGICIKTSESSAKEMGEESADRPESMTEMDAELEKILREEPVPEAEKSEESASV